MKERVKLQLETNIDLLKSLISCYNSESVLNYFALLYYNSDNLIKRTNLQSPYKQYFYLFGLLFSTDDITGKVYEEKIDNEVKNI